MTANPLSALLPPLQTARQLAAEFAQTAVERDERGGTPKAERDALRHSGLLALSIPVQYGGLGASWSETLTIVREFAKVDSSIAHVFGFHRQIVDRRDSQRAQRYHVAQRLEQHGPAPDRQRQRHV